MPQGDELWDTLYLWQSDNSHSLTSAPTPSSAQNNASLRSLKKPARSSKHFLNFGRRTAGSGLAVEVRARSRGNRSQRKAAGLWGMAIFRSYLAIHNLRNTRKAERR